MSFKYAIVAASVLSGVYAQAQIVSPSSNNIESIQVISPHSPIDVGQIAGSVTIIDESQIRASGAIGISELLRTVAGVNIGQTGPTGSLSEVRFRGSESNHIMVLVDGVAINDIGQGSLTDFSHLLVSNIERIEVLRGPQSAIWGSTAIAGIISITTKSADSNGLVSSVNIAAGNNRTHQGAAHVSKQSKQVGYKLNVSGYKTQGQNISRTGNEIDGYYNIDASGGINYQINQSHRINANARIVEYENDADSYDFTTGLVSDADVVARGKNISGAINWHFNEHQTGQEHSIYSQLLSLQYSQQDTNNYSNAQFDRASQGKKLRVLWSNRFEFTSNKWLNIGLESTKEEFMQQGLGPNNGINQQRSNNTWSLVSDGVYALSPALSLSGSYRWDNNDTFKNADSYRVGASYAIGRDWRVYVSQGQAITNPTFVERFGFFPDTFTGNPNLVPEQQKSQEIGIEGAFDTLSLQLNWFTATLNNEILGFVFIPDTGGFSAQNSSGKSQREGVEVSLQGQFKRLNWQAQYSYLDAKQENTIELRRARHSGSLSATYTHNAKHQYYIQADYTGSRFDSFFDPSAGAQTVALSNYWLLSSNYQYFYSNKLQINLRLSNALNKQYEDVLGYNTNARDFLVGITYQF